MKLAIKVELLENGSYIASVDRTKGDAGKIGTPGAVKYGRFDWEVYEKLQGFLESKGHTVIE